MVKSDEQELQRELELLRKNGLKDNPLRREYEVKVAGLAALAKELLAQGVSEKEAARTLHRKRRELGVQYKHAAVAGVYLLCDGEEVRRSAGTLL